jgi:cytochrome c oxidase cbb3-type subunit III
MMSGKNDIDEQTGIETTGHSWDGIRELNNPLPRWWLWTFYATIVFSICYMIAYPALPGLTGATKGFLNWSSRSDIRQEFTQVETARAAQRDRIKTMPIEQVLADPQLRQFAVSAGASLFKVNCVQCHGSGAQGSRGYPNLNDDSWIFGGTPAQILQTIVHGVRAADDPETRAPPDMPKFGDGALTPQQIAQVAEHVLKISAQPHDDALAVEGQKIFAENCASCHGDNGQGNLEQGAPQLNDAIWLYGGTKEDIVGQIKSPRVGMMPAWQQRLGETAVKELAAYVHSLGGGQ